MGVGEGKLSDGTLSKTEATKGEIVEGGHCGDAKLRGYMKTQQGSNGRTPLSIGVLGHFGFG